MAFATPKRVHFNKDVAKWSLDGPTPTIQRLSSLENKQDSTRTVEKNRQKSTNENSITVSVRVRPLSNKESLNGHYNAIKVSDEHNEITLSDRTNNKQHKFTSDLVITDQISLKSQEQESSQLISPDLILDKQQKYVYESIGKPLLKKAFDGYNVSVFAYGQTGSGKTYSMIGTNSQPGLIPRFFDDLFENKASRDQIVSNTYIEISYYEIYNEKVYDLLRSATTECKENLNTNKNTSNSGPASLNGRHLQIREDAKTGPYIVDLLKLSANSAADAKLWLDIGNKRRATACTNMNQKSSRSHSVFQINITQMLESNQDDEENCISKASNPESNTQCLNMVTSRVNLVDLAGSERINSALNNLSNLTSYSNSNQSRFKESTCINKSLLTLGKIINLLSERQNTSHSINSNSSNNNNNNAAMINSFNTVNNGHLPYRESVLTWLLKESLGGNAKTSMLATINASSCYIDETICTLRYATKTASIKNVAHLNFRQKYINEFGIETEIPLVITPSLSINNRKPLKDTHLEITIRTMEQEWKEKLEEAERLKQKEINDLEKSLIVLYENETRAQNCCLINLNEDPLLSEKLIYSLKPTSEDNHILIGSDKNSVNIHLIGPLIASCHCKIFQTLNDKSFYLKQLDKNYVTYLNGEVIDEYEQKLNHGDRIIFGGSHFFRFNNPSSSKNNQIPKSQPTDSQFKDYQFAKNEIEKKQNEELNKVKRDRDLKIKELEKENEKIKSDFEREKNARKLELEMVKSESNKKLKQIVKKKLIETKINEVENKFIETNQEIDKHERELTEDSYKSTPLMSNRFLNKLYSDKKVYQSQNIHNADQEIIQSHANSSSLFAITLFVTEANKICNALGFDYEFKRHEIMNFKSENLKLSKQQAICVIDKRLNLVTLWNLETFEHKLNMLRDIYLKYNEDESIASSFSSISNQTTESQLITDSMDEWQSLESYLKCEENFTPRIIENALGSTEGTISCKRRLSMLANAGNDNENLINSCSQSNINLCKSLDNLSDLSKTIDRLDGNHIDTSDQSNKRKHFNLTQNQTPILIKQKTPLLSSSCLTLKTKSFDSSHLLTNSNTLSKQISFTSDVYATCRDALNDYLEIDDDIYEIDNDYLDFYKTEEIETSNKEVDPDRKKISSKIPTVDDLFLKCYFKLIACLNKLNQIQLKNNSVSTNDMISNINNNDQPLYCIKVFQYISQISLFKPDYWSLINDENQMEKQKIVYRIKKLIKIVKDSINCLFQSIENNLESMTKSKYDSIINDLIKLINLQGQYTFLTCSNTFLNRDNYPDNIVDTKHLMEYISGIDKQFNLFIILKQEILKKDQNSSFFEFIECVKNFSIYQKTKLNESKDINSIDALIDYSNYLLRTHFRLSNAFKIIKSQQQIEDLKLKKKLNEQILTFIYNILTDALSINATDCFKDSDSKSSKTNWNDLLIDTFKALKSNIKSNQETNIYFHNFLK